MEGVRWKPLEDPLRCRASRAEGHRRVPKSRISVSCEDAMRGSHGSSILREVKNRIGSNNYRLPLRRCGSGKEKRNSPRHLPSVDEGQGGFSKPASSRRTQRAFRTVAGPLILDRRNDTLLVLRREARLSQSVTPPPLPPPPPAAAFCLTHRVLLIESLALPRCIVCDPPLPPPCEVSRFSTVMQ